MLSIAVVFPLLGAVVLLLAGHVPRVTDRVARTFAVSVGAVPLALMIVALVRFDTSSASQFQLVERAPWIPSIGASWRVGVDGIALAMGLLTTVLFLAAMAYPADTLGRARHYYGWFLFLESVCLGLFLSLDLLVFYVFFDLSLVGMYFLIARWGHGDNRRAALKFFLYTLAGSLVMLLGILGLALSMTPLTFDMAAIIAAQPLAGAGLRAALVLAALLVGLAVKTPLVPVHTWLPPAHVDAPGPASTILAGVMLKMGVFGMIRIPLSMMGSTFNGAAPILGIVAVVSIVYGSLVALGQTNIKARIAYTSVNHMGYAVLGVAVAGALAAGGSADGRRIALTGATVELVAHGLITGALFLVAGSLWQRTESYELADYGGLAGPAPRLTGATTLASFASLGLPGLAGFVAELQIFVGAFDVYPALAGVALLGLLITAALFVQMLQKVFFGDLPAERSDFRDVSGRESGVLAGLLGLVVVIGVYPRPLLDLVDHASRLLTGG